MGCYCSNLWTSGLWHIVLCWHNSWIYRPCYQIDYLLLWPMLLLSTVSNRASSRQPIIRRWLICLIFMNGRVLDLTIIKILIWCRNVYVFFPYLLHAAFDVVQKRWFPVPPARGAFQPHQNARIFGGADALRGRGPPRAAFVRASIRVYTIHSL